AAGRGNSSRLAPAARTAATKTTADAVLSLVSNMVRSTPSVRAATLAETAPEAAARPAAKRLAALIVDDNTEVGTFADAAPCASVAANPPPDSIRPCRARRLASITRA